MTTPLRRKYVNTAVVLADSFNRRFTPITLETPRALLPFVNATLIDYTIEFLVSAGIEVIYVFCVAHAEKIQEHLNSSNWGATVKPIVSSSARTVGDALRRIHDENVIETDFLICHGDVVGHLPLGEILYQHRLRKEQDPTTLMTTVYKRATPTHASRSLEDDTVVGLSEDNEILFWENSPDSGSVEVDPGLVFSDAKGHMRLRYDLLDTYVDMCSVEVLQLFKDNFDYQTLRGDFMSGVLGDDITDHRIFAHVVHNEYVVRVKDLRTYASVSRDVIHRWSAPVVVNNPLLLPNSSYRMSRGLNYQERGVAVHPTSRIGPHSVVGSGSIVGANSVVSKSVLGRNCKIGKNCNIINSFLWNNVEVEDNCNIEWSLLCNRVKVYIGVTIGKGSLLSYDVCVGPNVVLKAHTRLNKQHVSPDALGLPDSEEVTRSFDLGDKGKGVLWVLKEEESTNALHTSGRRVHSLDGGDTDDEDDVGASGNLDGRKGDADDDEGETEDSEIIGASCNEFEMEVREIVMDGIRGNSSIDNIALEINGRKFAHDKTFFECARCILWAFLASVPEGLASGKPLLTALQKILKQWKGLLLKFLQDGDAVELLWTLQEYLEKDFVRFAPIFQFIVHSLYDLDVLDEDSIWAWEKEQKDLVGEDRKFLEQCSKFLEWLRTADSDEE